MTPRDTVARIEDLKQEQLRSLNVEQIARYATVRINNIIDSLRPGRYDAKWIGVQKKYFQRALDLLPGVSEFKYLENAYAFAQRRENAFLERSKRKFLVVSVVALIPALAPLLPFASAFWGAES